MGLIRWLLAPSRPPQPREPDRLWPDERAIPIDHPLVPPAIRRSVERLWQAGNDLHRVQTDRGIEWWLLDRHGELIETFWLEPD